MKMIEEAEKFVYISSESFTDKEFPNFLKRIKLKDIDIKLLTGYTSMDFPDRMRIFIKELLAAGIRLRVTSEGLHTKLIITDKSIAITSINLNSINLGFKKTAGFWRENTETILICKDSDIVKEATQKYNTIFDTSEEIIDKIAEKGSTAAGSLFKQVFEVSSTSDAKLFLAKVRLSADINKEKFVLDILKLTIKIANSFNVRRISKKEVSMALILNHLAERKHDFNELSEKLNLLIDSKESKILLGELVRSNLIIKEQEFYKLNVGAIL